MTNDTLELLETIACARQQALDRTDPAQRALDQDYRTQWPADGPGAGRHPYSPGGLGVLASASVPCYNKNTF